MRSRTRSPRCGWASSICAGCTAISVPEFDTMLDDTVTRLLAEIDRLDRIARSFARYGAPPDNTDTPLETVALRPALEELAGLFALTTAEPRIEIVGADMLVDVATRGAGAGAAQPLRQRPQCRCVGGPPHHRRRHPRGAGRRPGDRIGATGADIRADPSPPRPAARGSAWPSSGAWWKGGGPRSTPAASRARGPGSWSGFGEPEPQPSTPGVPPA